MEAVSELKDVDNGVLGAVERLAWHLVVVGLELGSEMGEIGCGRGVCSGAE